MKRLFHLPIQSFILLIVIAGILVPFQTVFCETIEVNSPADTPDTNPGDGICLTEDKECTLRAAIMEANANPGVVHQIIFEINTAMFLPITINIFIELPPITTPIFIQGPNANDLPIILNGNGGDYNGLTIQDDTASGSKIENIQILNFGKNGILVKNTSDITISGCTLGEVDTIVPGNSGNGIHFLDVTESLIGGDSTSGKNIISRNGQNGILIEGGGNNQIKGNYIGLDLDGIYDRGNSENGILILNSSANIIGGTEALERNIISGNGANGIEVQGDTNTIAGNWIGKDLSGMIALPNNNHGIALISSDSVNLISNVIGGTTTIAGNLISGNLNAGVFIDGVDQTQILGNTIGVDSTHTTALPNSYGIQIINGKDNHIGSPETGGQNLISGNTNSGIYLSSAETTGTIIQNNLIGLNASQKPIPNGKNGITFHNASGTTIGGTAENEGNTIAYNTGDGIKILGSAIENQITGNAIFSNGELGINLVSESDPPNGITLNDNLDGDTGPNNLQNFPILTSITHQEGIIRVMGMLNSTPGDSFTLDFYGNSVCDPTGYGEGKVYLGSESIAIDDIPQNFSFDLSSFQEFAGITAMATDQNGNTSEFSNCALVFLDFNYLPLITK